MTLILLNTTGTVALAFVAVKTAAAARLYCRWLRIGAKTGAHGQDPIGQEMAVYQQETGKGRGGENAL
jgi:hypothetical protein